MNLLKNAVEATSDAGISPRITLTVRGEGPSVVITLTDNGPGIPQSALPRIFEVGYSTKGPGRGRGLSIVRESVHAQGGRIDVQSHEGEGTTFLITLPRAEADEASASS